MSAKSIVGGAMLFVACFLLGLGELAAAEAAGFSQNAAVKLVAYTLVAAAFPCFKYGSEFFDWCARVAGGGGKTATQVFVTKEQRACLLLAVIGLLVMVAGFIGYLVGIGGLSSDYFGEEISQLFWGSGGDRWYFYAARGGAIVALAFGILSITYKATVGSLVGWVRSGQ